MNTIVKEGWVVLTPTLCQGSVMAWEGNPIIETTLEEWRENR